MPRMHRWLNQPHMSPFYQPEPIALEAVREEYGAPARGEDPTLIHFALLDGEPFGYLQCYRIADYPDYAAEIGVPDGVGVDYFIGEPALLGRGLGRAMLRAYVDQVVRAAFPEQTRCVVTHDMRNAASGGVLSSAGFRFVRELVEAGVPSRMMELQL